MADEEVEESGSEFGKGLVVCLAKFSEHLSGRQARWVTSCHQWMQMSEAKRAGMEAGARQYPTGDSAAFVADLAVARIHVDMGHGDWDSALSKAMELWANGASDHFYDLDDSAPESLKELASLTLKMGHGYTQTTWTWDDWLKVHELWEKSCRELDERLGVQSDWGKW